MKLIVTDETYKYFSYHYPYVIKCDLELILKSCKPYEEHEYEEPLIPFDRNYLLLSIHRDNFLFHVPFDLSQEFGIPTTISLIRDSEGIIYTIHE